MTMKHVTITASAKAGARVSLTAVCAVVALLAIGAGPGVAAPTASYSAFMTHDSSCQLYVVATWKHSPVGRVFVNWYEDGNFIFTSQDATIVGNRAVSTVGPLYPTATSHDWVGLVNFYASTGEQLQQVYTAVDTSNCGIFGQ